MTKPKALLAGSMREAQRMLDVIAGLARKHLTRYSINKTVYVCKWGSGEKIVL
jgi:hypothetical protein